ncbi:MAG: hypothetical protein M3N17_08110 [Actinomycetota bacterium]|nr:hypothetical protein [Actinomycetota bacterium]
MADAHAAITRADAHLRRARRTLNRYIDELTSLNLSDRERDDLLEAFENIERAAAEMRQYLQRGG